MKFTPEQLLLLWGKTCRKDDDPANFSSRYHPLLFHLVDVAQVTLCLWDKLPRLVRRRIQKALGADEETAPIILALLAALHDLGKAAPGFQFQDIPQVWLHAKLLGIPLVKPVGCESKPHNFISTKELMFIWRSGIRGWRSETKEAGCVLGHIVGAHHGTFPAACDYNQWFENVIGDEAWREVRLALFDELIAALCPAGFVFPEIPDWEDRGAIPLLAGFISVADWVGSSAYFPPVGHEMGTMSMEEYLPLSQECAAKAVSEFGWQEFPKFNGPRPDFQDFWEFGPNALQREVTKLTATAQGPFLLLCEAQMGTGKTESSLWAHDAAVTLEAEWCNEGLYVGLPTQATSNPMHGRLKKYLIKRIANGQIHLQLVHGNALLSDQVTFQKIGTIYNQEITGDVPGRVVAMSWFTGNKRPLLAPYGVGTIDQSLLAVLQTRHWFVRLFGLAGKVIVIDEIHAYDTYMSGLLMVLLHWLKELGCTVILLSATLPSSKRCDMFKAWGAALPEKEKQYPRLTYCEADQRLARSIEVVREGEPKKYKIIHLSPEKLRDHLLDKLANGGCAAIICNTVNEAQRLFQTLSEDLEMKKLIEPKNMVLFHARLPFKWRQARERKILHLFGKTKANRPKCALTVATQVLEQSIDVDYDWMASFPAPADLLLQRLGREHRHEKDENDQPVERYGLDEPEFAILLDTPIDVVPDFGASAYVYEPEILLRSWLAWHEKKLLTPDDTERKLLTLPDDIEPLVEATYEQNLMAPNDAWKLALKKAGERAEKNRNAAKNEAGNVVIPLLNSNGNARSPEDIADQTYPDLQDDEDPRLHEQVRASTRLGDPAIKVICLCRVEGKLYLPRIDGRPNLKRPVDLNQEPDRNQTRRLMDYFIPLSQRQLYGPLAAQKPVEAWKKSPVLKHARTLIFENGVASVGKYKLTLDRQLGLVIEKEGQENKDTGAG